MSARILITAGPTHEPLDAVRYLGNRSSGRLGLALAAEAAGRGLPTTLLLGPTPLGPSEPTQIDTHRFRTTAELQSLLAAHWPGHDVLIMAAAVADFRPADSNLKGKIRRTKDGLELRLEPTPDLLVEVSERSRPDQTLIGFALEDPSDMISAARAKLGRKGLDGIVANPLRTLDASDIAAVLLTRDGATLDPGGVLSKAKFAAWLLDRVLDLHAAKIADRSAGQK